MNKVFGFKRKTDATKKMEKDKNKTGVTFPRRRMCWKNLSNPRQVENQLTAEDEYYVMENQTL